MKTLIFTILIVLISTFCFAQNQFVSDNRFLDSLKHALAIVRQDTSRSLILAQISNYYKFTRPDSSVYYGNKALLLARKLKFPKGELSAMQFIIVAYFRLGNSSRVLQICLEAIKIAEKNNLTNELADKLYFLGNIYLRNKNYKKSLPIYKRAKILFDSTKNQNFSVMSQSVIGKNYMLLNQLDSASYYCLLAYKNAVNLKVNWVINSTLIKLIRLEKKKGNNSKALYYSHQIISPDKDFNINTELYLMLSDIYKALNEPDSCIYYIKKSLNLSQEIGDIPTIIDANVAFSNFYEKSNAPLALQYSQKAIFYKDSLSSLLNRTTIESFTNFDEQERQYEIDTATTAYRNRIAFFVLLAGLAVFLFIAFILYRNNQKEKKAKTLLQEQKEKVEHTLSQLKSTQTQLIQREKMASLGELTAGIAHEIQNPLNFVNNFAEVSVELADELIESVQLGQTDSAQELATDLRQNLQHIIQNGQRASNIVRGMLEHSRTSTGERLPTDLNALCDEYFRLAYQGARAKNSSFTCQLETHFETDLPLVSVVASDISRVLLNLFNNAFYAVGQKQKTAPADYMPTVSVSTRKLAPPSGAGGAEIRVRDNGMGIPDAVQQKIFQPFFTTKPTGEGTGLGLSLSYDIVTKGHGGGLSVESQSNEYSEFIISLPTT